VLADLIDEYGQDKGNKLVHYQHKEPKLHVVFQRVPDQRIPKGPDVIAESHKIPRRIHYVESEKADQHPHKHGVVLKQQERNNRRQNKKPAGIEFAAQGYWELCFSLH
jgi:hypothetical protein